MNRPRRIARQSLMRTLLVPGVLLIVSIVGLILALTGDGTRDWIAALLLALPVAAIFRAWFAPASFQSKTIR